MFDKMKQLMEMKKQAEMLKRELDALVLDVREVSGIRMQINGSQNFKSVEIDDSYFEDGLKGKLESDLLRSINAAVAKSQAEGAKKMKSVIPGFPGA